MSKNMNTKENLKNRRINSISKGRIITDKFNSNENDNILLKIDSKASSKIDPILISSYKKRKYIASVARSNVFDVDPPQYIFSFFLLLIILICHSHK